MPLSSASCLLMSVFPNRCLTNKIVQIFYVESGVAFYEHCGRDFAYYECHSRPNNGTFHKTIFSFTVCCAAQY